MNICDPITTDPSRVLAWLTGNIAGWATQGDGIECLLCGKRGINGQKIFEHGLKHLTATDNGTHAFVAALAILVMGEGISDWETANWRTRLGLIKEAMIQTYGFAPRSTAALQFWKEHGGS